MGAVDSETVNAPSTSFPASETIYLDEQSATDSGASESCQTAFKFPPLLLQKCLVPYSTSTPTLDGFSIVSADSSALSPKPARSATTKNDPRILLASGPITCAVSTISSSFSALASGKIHEEERTLPVTALCSPHHNSLTPLDAAVRYIAHQTEADIIILDPADLAAGRHGVYGQELTEAFWELYNYHYAVAPEPKDKDSPPASPPGTNIGEAGVEAEEKKTGEKSAADAAAAKVREEARLRLASAKSVVKSFLLANSTTGTRRLIYLRDYGALFKALSPLLSTLHEVLVPSETPILILAGISPVERTPTKDEEQKDKHPIAKNTQDLFASIGESLDDLEKFLDERCNAQWRKPAKGRFTTVEHIFTVLFEDRYHAAGGLMRRRRDDDHFFHHSGHGSSESDCFNPLQEEEQFKLMFSRIIRVGIVRGGLPAVFRDKEKARQKRRFLLANLWPIHASAAFGIPEVLRAVATSDAYTGQDLDWDVLSRFQSAILEKGQLKQLGATLSSNIQITGVLDAFATLGKSNAQWGKVLEAATEDKGKDGSKPDVDPILQRVKDDRSLNQWEMQLLSSVTDPTEITTSFSDVCIRPEVTDTLRTGVILPMRFPDAFKTGVLAKESMGGVLLFGPPGTGKTMVCRALAKECGARMLHIKASTIQRSLVGEIEQLIAATFSLARRLGPCIVFIDEIDALFCSRNSSSMPWNRTTVTEFCEQLDGLETAKQNRDAGLLVIGATNHPQDIDTAVLRRLSRRLLVDLPNLEQRKGIISKYLEGERHDTTVDVDDLAKRTAQFSGSDLRYLVHSAALAAFRETLPTTLEEATSSVDGNPKGEKKAADSLLQRIIRGKHFERALAQVSAISGTNNRELDELRKWSGQAGVAKERWHQRILKFWPLSGRSQGGESGCA